MLMEKILSQYDIEIEILKGKIHKVNKLEDIILESIDASTINNRFVSNTLYFDQLTHEHEIKSNILMNSYILNNQKANACFYDILINTYKDAIENAKHDDGRKIYKLEMTYVSLFRLFNPDYENFNDEEFEKIMNENMGLTLEKSKIFFEKFKLNLCVINPNNKIIFEYKSEKQNKHINPKTLNIIYHNNHVYPINKIKNFTKIINTNQEKLNDDLEVSNKFNLARKEDKNVIIMKTKTFEEILKYIENASDEKYIFICNEELKTLAYEICTKYKHEPNVNIQNGIIKSISTKLIVNKREVKLLIKLPFDNIEHVFGENITEKKYYDKFFDERENIFIEYLNANLLSTYNKSTLESINMYYPNIQYGLNNEIDENKQYAYLDYTKAYLSMFLKMEYLPVINYAEVFRKYDNHEIKNYNLYLIEINEYDDVFNKSMTHIYGFNLKELNLKYKIIEYLEPTRLVSNKKCKKIFEKLYSTELDISHKKNIGNVLIGYFGKKYNTIIKSLICKNYETAYQHKQSNNDKGFIFNMNDGKFYYCRKNMKAL